MSIILLDQYHAYAPPFDYKNPKTLERVIGGLEERVEYDKILLSRLLDAWNNSHLKLTTREWQIPSAHAVGVFYTVKHMTNGWICTCPARRDCWHIKICKEQEMEESKDDLSGQPRSEEERYG